MIVNDNPWRPMELLAPAGGPDCGMAALQYGADAVYLGLKKFWKLEFGTWNFGCGQVPL